MTKPPILVTLTGPSCAGKSHLERLLKERGFVSIVSVTTRKPRAGEVNGQHYHFLTDHEFAVLAGAGELVESVELNCNRYGVTKEEILRVAALGKPIVVVVEPHGAKQYRRFTEEAGWNFVPIFINNPPEVIARRFLERYTFDIEAGNCGALAGHPARLAAMMTEERGWVKNSFLDDYAFVFDRFDDESTYPIVNFIVNHVELTMALAGNEEAA